MSGMRKVVWAAAVCVALLWPGAALADTPAKAPPGVDCLITEWGFSPYDAGVVGFTGVAADGSQCGGEGDTNDPNAVPSDALGSTNNVRALILAMSAPDWGANVGPAAKFSDELEAKLKAAGVNLGWVYQKLYQNSGEPEPPWVPQTPQKPYVNQTSESGGTTDKTSGSKTTTTVRDSSGKTATVTESGGETTVTTTDSTGKSRTTTLDERSAAALRERLGEDERALGSEAVTPVAVPGGATVEVPGGGLNEGFERAASSEVADVWAAAAAAQRRFQARFLEALGAAAGLAVAAAVLLVLARLGVLARWRRELAWRVEGWRYARRQGRW